jgi:cation diffusion facilitator family transporter
MISTHDQAVHSRDAKRATYIAAWLDGLLGCAKVVVGALVGSAALVADGIHSFSDLVTDGFVLAATHYGRQGPDHDHHYGHGRIETLATLVLGSVLIFVAGAIAWSSLQRLLGGTEIAAPGIWAMLLALAALLAKEWLFHYTMRIAKRVKSKLLEANAWHSRTDVLSTALVLVALLGAQFGAGWMDAIAAVIVGLLVGKVGWDLLWESARELVDTALPDDAQQRMHQVALEVPGVEGVHDLRTRQSAGHAFADLHVVVGPRISVSEAHEIGNEVSRRLRQAYPALSDVTFHIDPEDDAGEGDPSRFPGLPLRPEVDQVLAERWSDLPGWERLAEYRLHYLEGTILIEVHVDHNIDDTALRRLPTELNDRIADIDWLAGVRVVKRLQ